MASIVLAACPFSGHVGPAVELARALVAAGHRVRVLTGAGFADRVTSVGAEHVGLPPAADLDESHILGHFPERADLGGLAAARFDMTRIFLDPLPHQLAALDALHEADPVDVVVAEPLFMGALGLSTRPQSRRPALATLGTMPLMLSSRHTPPPGPGLPPLRGPLAPLLHRGMGRAIGFALRDVQAHAQQRLRDAGCDPATTLFSDWPLRSEAIVQLTVAALEYPRPDVDVPIHFVGSLRAPSMGDVTDRARPSWWGDLDRAAAVVHVTQGTATNLDFGQLLVPTAQALTERDVLVVATTGGRPLGDLPARLPANARVAEYLDYDALLPRTDVMVTNGGYGGVQQALAHGIPLVVAGAQQDKAEVAARVRWSGTGITTRTLTPGQDWLERSVGRVLHDPAFAAATAAVRDEFASAPGATGAVRIIEDLATSP